MGLLMKKRSQAVNEGWFLSKRKKREDMKEEGKGVVERRKRGILVFFFLGLCSPPPIINVWS